MRTFFIEIYLIDLYGFAKELNHVHDLYGIVGIFFGTEFDEGIALEG
jgi:hypothetical protein